jgi:hypothetical protein
VICPPARAGGEIAVLPYQLYPAFTDAHDVRQYQLVWDGTELVARVVSSVTPSDVKERIRRGVEATLAAAGATAPPIRVVPVDAIEREAGHAAKMSSDPVRRRRRRESPRLPRRPDARAGAQVVPVR